MLMYTPVGIAVRGVDLLTRLSNDPDEAEAAREMLAMLRSGEMRLVWGDELRFLELRGRDE